MSVQGRNVQGGGKGTGEDSGAGKEAGLLEGCREGGARYSDQQRHLVLF